LALTASELKYLRSLQTKKGRKSENRFLAEGVRLLEEALAADYLPVTLLYAPSEVSPRGEMLVNEFVNRKVKVQTISAKECHRLSDTKVSQGIIAMFNHKTSDLKQQLKAGYRRILVCDKVGDPGNLGTLMRSAAAFEFGLIITTAGSAESINAKTIRASMGAFFRLPIVCGIADHELPQRLRRAGYRIFTADIKGKYIGHSTPLTGKTALVIGSEATGAGRVFSNEADLKIKIPMSKKTESLNSAMAGTILMFWMNSRERAKK
jgi:TrmH family RNA methyltransferase